MSNLCSRVRSSVINCAMSDSATPESTKWCVDTVTTRHMTPYNTHLENKQLLSNPFMVELPDGKQLLGSEVGDVTISPDLILKDVVCVPGLKEPLLSVSYLDQTTDRFLFWFDRQKCQVQDYRSGKVVYTGLRDADKLYYVNTLEMNDLHLHKKEEIDEGYKFKYDRILEEIQWVVNSKSRIHVTGEYSLLRNIRLLEEEILQFLRDMNDDVVTKLNEVCGEFPLGRGGILLRTLCHHPEHQMNTLSIGQLCDEHNHLAFFFASQHCYLVDTTLAKGNKIIAIGRKHDCGRYVLKCAENDTQERR